MDREAFFEWLTRIYGTTESEIDCERLQKFLPAYAEAQVAGGVPADRSSEVVAHLSQCPDCAEEYEGLYRVIKLEAQGKLPQVQEILAQSGPETARESPREFSVPAS